MFKHQVHSSISHWLYVLKIGHLSMEHDGRGLEVGATSLLGRHWGGQY